MSLPCITSTLQSFFQVLKMFSLIYYNITLIMDTMSCTDNRLEQNILCLAAEGIRCLVCNLEVRSSTF